MAPFNSSPLREVEQPYIAYGPAIICTTLYHLSSGPSQFRFTSDPAPGFGKTWRVFFSTAGFPASTSTFSSLTMGNKSARSWAPPAPWWATRRPGSSRVLRRGPGVTSGGLGVSEQRPGHVGPAVCFVLPMHVDHGMSGTWRDMENTCGERQSPRFGGCVAFSQFLPLAPHPSKTTPNSPRLRGKFENPDLDLHFWVSCQSRIVVDWGETSQVTPT